RLRRQAFLFSESHRPASVRRLFRVRAALHVAEHERHQNVDDDAEDEEAAREDDDRAHIHIARLVAHIRVLDVARVRRQMYVVNDVLALLSHKNSTLESTPSIQNSKFITHNCFQCPPCRPCSIPSSKSGSLIGKSGRKPSCQRKKAIQSPPKATAETTFSHS